MKAFSGASEARHGATPLVFCAATRMKTLLILLISTGLSWAAEPVTGAFGIQLGQKFDPSRADRDVGPNGVMMFRFEPQAPYPKLTHYYVMITPKSRLVYGIVARGEIEDEEDREREAKILRDFLYKKYGIMDRIDQSQWNIMGNRERQVVVSSNSPELMSQLQLIYLDSALLKLLSVESRPENINQAAPDFSGL